METLTKYNIGDEVWLMHENKAICFPVVEILLHIYQERAGFIRQHERYGVKQHRDDIKPTYYDVFNLFPSKEELLKSL